MANMEKLNQTLRYIRTHFELWDQTTWFKPFDNDEFTTRQIVDMILEDPYDPVCGVTGCMAGLAAFQNGYVPIFKVQGDGDWADVNPGEFVAKRDPVTGKVDRALQVTTRQAAAEIFEIDATTASRLFDSDNDFETLQAMVAHIGEHGSLESFGGHANCSCGVPGCDYDDDSFHSDSYDEDYEDEYEDDIF